MVLVRETVLADRQALRDAPCAFSSTYEDQVKLGEADWRQPIARGGTFLAYLFRRSAPPKPAPSRSAVTARSARRSAPRLAGQ